MIVPTIVEEMSSALAIMYERMELQGDGETDMPTCGFSPQLKERMIHLALKASSTSEGGFIVFLSPTVVQPTL
jgi:hypothetical protein